LWKGLVLVALLIELVVIVVLVGNRPDVVVAEAEDPVSGSSAAEDSSSSDGARFEDPDVPYSFAYPKGWEIESGDSVTKLLSPGNDIAIAVGPAPPGDVLVASDRLIEGVTERYSDAETKGRELTNVGGNLGLTVTGTAVNEFGVRLRFAIVTIEGTADNENFAITSFAAADGKSPERAVQQVVDDFAIE
jgi:hypothetical protein